MDFLERVYELSTNPETRYPDLLTIDVGLSVIAHAVAYGFIGHAIWPSRSIGWFVQMLVPVLVAGYALRLHRAKALTVVHGKDRAKELMDHMYKLWYFVG